MKRTTAERSGGRGDMGACGRRTFVRGAALLALGLALPGCTGTDGQNRQGKDATTAAGDVVVATRIDPRGSGAYPSAEKAGCTFADPLVEDLDFEPLMVSEEGGTRVVTPFFSIFVPDDMFPGGWSASYSGYMMNWGGAGSGNGPWMGHDLTIVPNDATDAQGLGARVTSTDWDGIQGELVAISVGPAPADDHFQVVVHGPADYATDHDGTRSRKALAPYANLVSPYIAAARDTAGAWQTVAISQPWPEVSEETGQTVLATPWYSVALAPELWPNGCSYRFNGKVDQQTGGGGEHEASRFLELYDTATQDLAGIMFLDNVENADVQDVLGRYYAWQEVGASATETGQYVYAAIPTGDAQPVETDDDFEAIREAVRPQLEQLTSCVTVR